ncbi:ARF guanyl-nucleotide exchange factor [Rhodotorula toruloides NP11]|uniref:ARF guanyl-nucleotide exchange factor n=1 Tax=Rhodotorula toruloides (strain NP11) TaxID=1130832 RepID=M7X7G8_RHOT1|nr:ARF guanyl-nucleotide exchange factor [Rhodotorula toruloides NP11]EMS19609.1 ARF guanyl-nucleotide exchange factor [Rhodotorula toruloides NP11]
MAHSPPRQPTLQLSPSSPSVPHPASNTSTHPPLALFQPAVQPGSLSTLEKRRARSRSPSPSPVVSPVHHLAQAGLGLASPGLPASPFGMHGDELERLVGASERQEGQRGRTTSLGFVEPEMPQRSSQQQSRGRERKKSFIGLGFGGGNSSESEGASLGRRRFGLGGGASSNAVDNPARALAADGVLTFRPVLDLLRDSPSRSTPAEASSPVPDHAKPTPKKGGTSGARAFLRRARSFGTSPVLGSSNGGTFAAPTLADQHPPLPLSSPVLPLPRLSTSSLSVDTASPVDSPAPLSGTSTPLTPHSPYYHNYPSTSSAYLPSPQLGRSHSSSATGSTMVLPEPIPSQPHWLFAPAPSSSASRDAASSPRSSVEQSRRRSADERTRDSHESSSGRSITHGKGKGKAKEGERERGLSAPSPAQTPKRKTRRATLGGLFGRKEPKAGRTTRENSLASDGVPTASIPSLPSLPSLQLSNNPYRMSWAFGRESPSNSPEKGRSDPPTSSRRSPSRGERPTLSITTTPTDTPAPASPVDQVSPSRPPLVGAHTLPLPIAPPLEQAKSSDSGSTLMIRAPAQTSASPTTPTPPGYVLSRGGLSASTPPSLRRSNSYAPPSTSRVAFAGSTAPLTPSPLSSPVKERLNPLSTSSSPGAEAPPPLPSPGSTTAPQASPSLARTLIKTRAARSQSDASDRRSPSLSTPPAYAFSGRNMVVGGLGIPPGGGYFAQAHQKVGASRLTTADSTTGGASLGGRSSVFGSLGSFFGGGAAASQNMSRSSSAATTGTTGGGTPATSPGLSTAGEVSEFGALFDQKRSSSQARPNSSRRRGLSVGAGIGSFFGGGGSAGTGSVSSLHSIGPSPSSATTSPSKVQMRERSGSASSVNSSTLAPPDYGGSVGGRMRALTDPNRRFSFSLGGAPGGSASLAPPGSSGGRPVTADGSTSSAGRGNRSRGNSLSTNLPPEPKKVRKPPKPRDGESPEEYVRRLVEGDSASRRASRVETADGDAQEVMLDSNGNSDSVSAEKHEEEGDEANGPLPKGEVTKILSLSADPFYAAALQAYLRYFPFQQLALDIALRVFLCSASLPSETQQIDRVMEAFARRYVECNPGLFGPPPKKRDVGDEGLSAEGTEEGRFGARKDGQQESDVPYVLAFSMVMLNTDHFNPNAKSKMTKADYIKNTRIDGVAPEILEYLYDQITLAPFIFVDDGMPGAGFLGPSTSTASLLGGSIGPSGSSASVASSAAANSGLFTNNASKGKVDPYHLIATNQTRRFRVDVESHIPSKSPFSFSGTTSFFDTTSLHSLFARAPVLQIQNRPRTSRSNSSTFASAAPYSLPLPSPPVTTVPLPPSPDPALAGSPLTPTVSNGTFIADAPKKKDRPPISSLKITKVGLLSRKEDLAEGGKKAASRKWRGWSVVLTGSQLLFFKDPNFAAALQQSLRAAAQDSTPRPNDSSVLSFTYPGSFKPDAVLSLANTAAIYDATYSKYRNVFRFVAPAGRQYLFQAHNEDELNSWLSAINFSAAFKSANIRIRPLQPAFPSPLPSSPRPSLSPFQPQPAFDSARAPASEASSRPTTPRMVRSAAQDSLATAQSPNLLHDGSSTTPRSSSATPSRSDDISRPSIEDRDDETPLSMLMTPRAGSLGTSASGIAGASQPITARADLLRSRINNLDVEIRSAKERLQADLRLAKHLAILTPFRSATRERVLMAIPPIEKRVRHTRMHLAKLICYREVLSRDLLVEDREAERLLRKHSLHRTHSRRTSSVPRQRSPSRQHSRHSSATGPARPSHLSHSTTSPRRMKASHTDSERTSFESAAESLSALANGTDLDQPLSLTDDELDRLQLRSPPLMQRSKTETDWQNVVPLERLSLDPPDPSASNRLRSNSELLSEDDFESRLRDSEGRARASSASSNGGARSAETSPPPPTIHEGVLSTLR